MTAARLRPGFRQWLVLLAVFVGGAAAAVWNDWLWRTDLAFYDAALPARPAAEDIVIVAIDDASLAEIGRWPWPRAVHAALLERVQAAGARAIGLDLIFSEPGRVGDAGDEALERAVAAGPPTVLPLLFERAPDGSLRESLPIPALIKVARALGHVHLELDRDGIARSVFLLEGLGLPRWPYFGLALLETARGPSVGELPGERHPDPGGGSAAWVRDYQVHVPFAGPPGHFRYLSYADVLRGAVSAEQLRGKLVLVGATAQGMGDAYPTPRSGHGRAMPGVEIAANVVQALRDGTTIRRIAPIAHLGLAVLPVLAAFAGFLWLSPRRSLLLVAALLFAVPAASFAALHAENLWIPPSAAIAALLLAYPVWSWRRLEAAQGFLEEELDRLAAESLPQEAVPSPRYAADVVQRSIDRLRSVGERVRILRRDREELLRFLSHDIRSPLSSLVALARMQGDAERRLPTEAFAAQTETLARRALLLAEGMVNLARAEALDPARLEATDLIDAATDATDEVWAIAKAKEIRLETSLHIAPAPVRGDRHLLARAVVNLLGNAVKHSPAGSIVRMSVDRTDDGFTVAVADDGPGIPPAEQSKLFKHYSRIDLEQGGDPGGTGLGLALVRAVAAKHGGRVSVQSETGSGATFALWIPRWTDAGVAS
jgi:CHASE2 domain-containing sensor protein/nitrogen-specific signal transduction histidine kinase